jgi:hypothetical protein
MAIDSETRLRRAFIPVNAAVLLMNNIGPIAECLSLTEKSQNINSRQNLPGGTAPMIRFFELFEKGAGRLQGGTIQVAAEGELATNNQITTIRIAFVQ